ncbi:ankyrin repeat domain-containing protein 27-like [Uloborus diversus]|uniref:ankyrin repeat domain-containing protein 27-like n=1 Tax=Uloborus diversus TaxID=327109 RepID=UPI002409032A|nr:ankyrin repeat domain-containing protein 27-like [Uloborus diversus]
MAEEVKKLRSALQKEELQEELSRQLTLFEKMAVENNKLRSDLYKANAKCKDLEAKMEELRSRSSDSRLLKCESGRDLNSQESPSGTGCQLPAAGPSCCSRNLEEIQTLRKRLTEALAVGAAAFHAAVIQDDVEKLKKLLAKGFDIHSQYVREQTSGHLVIPYRRRSAEQFLVDANATNDFQDDNGCAPLHKAAFWERVETLKKLLATGAKTGLQNNDGKTLLRLALDSRKVAIAELLLEADDLQDGSENTPLCLAAKGGYASIVKKLLSRGASPHIRNDERRQPLNCALMRGHDAVVKLILAMCAWKDISMDWQEMQLPKNQVQRYMELFSDYRAEIRRMKEVRIGESRVSFYDVLRRPASKVAPYLRIVDIRHAYRCNIATRVFPDYADLIIPRLRKIEERRLLMDQCLICFPVLVRQLPPFPLTCIDIVLSYLDVGGMRNLVFATQFES